MLKCDTCKDRQTGLNSEIDSCSKVAYHFKIAAKCKISIQNYVQNDIGIDLIDLQNTWHANELRKISEQNFSTLLILLNMPFPNLKKVVRDGLTH